MKMQSETWPTTRVVAQMMGSLPMGGVVPETPIFAFERTPDALSFDPHLDLTPTRTDIDVGGPIAFTVNSVVSASEAQAIIDASELFGFRDEAPGITTPPGMRMNKSVHWMADEAMLNPIMRRINHLLPPCVDGHPLHGRFSHRINMYRYDENDVFNRHIDGDWPAFCLDASRSEMIELAGLRSALTMILYLNGPEDGVEGGNTRLLTRDGAWIDVTPSKGSALFFRHGFTPESVIHVGDRVRGQVSKYVARINVMYDMTQVCA